MHDSCPLTPNGSTKRPRQITLPELEKEMECNFAIPMEKKEEKKPEVEEKKAA
jgi:hypothetical protein